MALERQAFGLDDKDNRYLTSLTELLHGIASRNEQRIHVAQDPEHATRTINLAVNIGLNPLPTDAEELARCLADPEWRLFSGCLYKIMIKGEGPRRDSRTFQA